MLGRRDLHCVFLSYLVFCAIERPGGMYSYESEQGLFCYRPLVALMLQPQLKLKFCNERACNENVLLSALVVIQVPSTLSVEFVKCPQEMGDGLDWTTLDMFFVGVCIHHRLGSRFTGSDDLGFWLAGGNVAGRVLYMARDMVVGVVATLEARTGGFVGDIPGYNFNGHSYRN